jgi:hypothetical protein
MLAYWGVASLHGRGAIPDTKFPTSRCCDSNQRNFFPLHTLATLLKGSGADDHYFIE